MSTDSSAIQIDSTTAADEPVLNRLMQLYAYDFSEFMGWDVAADGLYFSGDPKVQARSEPGRYTFLVRRAGQLAGFAIVDERSRITGDAGVMDMAEFFILRKYRRQGLGAQVATRLFDLFRRRWEIRELQPNAAARAFWCRTIAAYTDGNYGEELMDDERWRGYVQTFSSARP